MGLGRPKRYELTALDPYDDSGARTWQIWLEQRQIEFITKGRLDARWFRLTLVQEVVAHPDIVFGDLKRPGQDEGLCYVGEPVHDRPAEGIEIPRRKGLVFAVVVMPSGKISDWRWDDWPDYPDGWEKRFGRIAWPKNQLT